MAHYIPTNETVTADALANMLIRDIVRLHGVPKSIVSDRGSVFTSGFWTTFGSLLQIRRNLSTAFHPQTDGQTERQNQTLETYLRAYCNYLQDDWVKWLPLAEFSYNNSAHSGTGFSPFFLATGFEPEWQDALDEPLARSNVEAEERIEFIKDIRKETKVLLERSRWIQAKYYNNRHLRHEFKVGDKVYLSTRNIKTKRPKTKLDNKMAGLYSVVEVMPSGLAYRLDLKGNHGRIHDVFHISLLEPERPSKLPGRDVEPLPMEIVDGEEWWEVDAIMDARVVHNRPQYRVRWKGFPPSEDMWLPWAEVQQLDVFKNFMREHPEAPSPVSLKKARLAGKKDKGASLPHARKPLSVREHRKKALEQDIEKRGRQPLVSRAGRVIRETSRARNLRS
jgi:hypothetical protein